jgi:hypothetical protein
MIAKNEKAPTFISAITIAVITKNRASGANTDLCVVGNAISNVLRLAWLIEYGTAVIAAFIAHKKDDQRIDIDGNAGSVRACAQNTCINRRLSLLDFLKGSSRSNICADRTLTLPLFCIPLLLGFRSGGWPSNWKYEITE